MYELADFISIWNGEIALGEPASAEREKREKEPDTTTSAYLFLGRSVFFSNAM